MKVFLECLVAYWLIFWVITSTIALTHLAIKDYKSGEPLFGVIAVHLSCFAVYSITLYLLPVAFLFKEEERQDAIDVLLTPFTFNFLDE